MRVQVSLGLCWPIYRVFLFVNFLIFDFNFNLNSNFVWFRFRFRGSCRNISGIMCDMLLFLFQCAVKNLRNMFKMNATEKICSLFWLKASNCQYAVFNFHLLSALAFCYFFVILCFSFGFCLWHRFSSAHTHTHAITYRYRFRIQIHLRSENECDFSDTDADTRISHDTDSARYDHGTVCGASSVRLATK